MRLPRAVNAEPPFAGLARRAWPLPVPEPASAAEPGCARFPTDLWCLAPPAEAGPEGVAWAVWRADHPRPRGRRP